MKYNKKQYKEICEDVISEVLNNEREKLFLTEMAPPIVDYNREDPFIINLTPRDPDKGDVFYFKLHDGTNYDTAEKLCRISILEPEYERWHSTPGKVELTLTGKGKKWLVQKLAKPNNKKPEMTNLEFIIDYLNEHNKKQIPLDYIKPEDYFNLTR